jgi:hypothetical protein
MNGSASQIPMQIGQLTMYVSHLSRIGDMIMLSDTNVATTATNAA